MISMVQDIAGHAADERFGGDRPRRKRPMSQAPAENAAPTAEPSNVGINKYDRMMGEKRSLPKGLMQKNFFGEIGSAVENATGIGGDRRIDPIGDVKNVVSTVGNVITNPMGTLKNAAQGAIPGQDRLNSAVTNVANTIAKAPQESTADVAAEQQRQYSDYMKNLPQYQQKAQEQLSSRANKEMFANMANVEQKNTSRGLGYGNLNEAMKEQERSKSQQDLASQISQSNLGLLDLGNQIKSGAIDTGLGIQRILQDRLNQQYSRQMADYNRQQQGQGQVLGLLGQLGVGAMLA